MAPQADAPVAIVTLTSDFGTRDTYVGAMKGALLSIDASLSLIDLTHHIAGPYCSVADVSDSTSS